MAKWLSNAAGTAPPPDAGATQKVADATRASERSGGFLTIGTMVTVVAALSATLFGGGLATRHSQILDGNTWVVASTRDGIERLLRVNPGSGEVDLNTPSPAPAGRTVAIDQSNATTAVVDATTGDTYAWNPVAGDWQKSTTRVFGQTALHLTATSAFSIDRAAGTVRQLEPGLLSTSVGSPITLAAAISESTVDGSGQLWLAMPKVRRVVSVQGSQHGPVVTHEFTLPSSGAALSLTALRAGVLAADPGEHTTYRLFPDRGAAERITGVPPSATAINAASSDDDTGAVLDPDTATLTRVTPTGDARARRYRLAGELAHHRFGRPVVFGDKVYVPDYTAGTVLRTSTSSGVEAYPPQPLTADAGDFDLFVDDGRLWVNAHGGAKAFTVDRAGRWTPITKFEQRKIKLPEVVPQKDKPRPAPRPSTSNKQQPPDPQPTIHRPGPSATEPAPTDERPTHRPPKPTRTTAPPSQPPPSPSLTPSPTTAAPPDPPENLTAEIGDRSLTVTWQAAAETDSPVTGYVIDWTGPDGEKQQVDRGARSRRYVITGLTNGAVYTVTATAKSTHSQSEPAQTTATPLTTASATVTDARATGRGRITVDFAVDTHDSGGVTCKITLNGQERWSGGCASTDSQVINALDYGTGYDIVVEASNERGSTSSESRNVTTWGAPTVTISKGASAVGVGNPVCRDPSCAWITVHIENFTPGENNTLTGDSTRGGGFPERSITAGDDGKATTSGPGQTYYFGYQGQSIWVFAGGIESNHLSW